MSRIDHRAGCALAGLSLAEIRARWFSEPGQDPPPRILAALAEDRRAGARALATLAGNRRSAHERRRQRGLELLVHEQPLWQKGLTRVAGVDEAGVGPLAGPVVAAAVILPPGTLLPGLDDSKRLTASRREELYQRLQRLATAIGVGLAEPEEIDHINIFQASLQAMARAVAALRPAAQHLLVDARRVPGTDLPQEGLIGGDARSASIAAASVIAKVTRDRLMQDYDLTHPGYGFARHKGYPTAEHQDAVRRLGASPIHRRSFLKGLAKPRQSPLFAAGEGI